MTYIPGFYQKSSNLNTFVILRSLKRCDVIAAYAEKYFILLLTDAEACAMLCKKQEMHALGTSVVHTNQKSYVYIQSFFLILLNYFDSQSLPQSHTNMDLSTTHSQWKLLAIDLHIWGVQLPFYGIKSITVVEAIVFQRALSPF